MRGSGLSLIDLGPELIFDHAGEVLTALFLLVIAGIASMQLFQRPREIQLLLLAVALTMAADLGWMVTLDVAFNHGLPWAGLASNDAAYFVLESLGCLCQLLIYAASWWCVLQAAFVRKGRFGPGEAAGGSLDANKVS